MARRPRAALPAAPTNARLPRAFFERPVDEVARALIGCALVHRGRAALIVETEAYFGAEDLASHARFGATARTAPMFGPAGHAYVYLCYGTHEMFNIVAQAAGSPAAVLIRGAAPLHGLPEDPAIARGPGKLTAALGLHRRHSGLDLTAEGCAIAIAPAPPAAQPPPLVVGPRVGVAYAGAWARTPLRFAWRAHPSVSRPAPVTPWP